MGNTLNIKQETFCIEYCKDFNAAAAARRSGYSEKTAYNIGWENLRKRAIQDRIAELLNEQSMKPDEVKKRLSDIARGDMGDYIIAVPTPYTPKVKIGLEELIHRLRNEIDFEDNYALQVDLKEKELEKHMKAQEQRRRMIIRYKLELESNPAAYRVVDGETTLVDQPQLDIIALSRDKEKGKIKSFKQTKDGVQVELYPADNALANMAKVYALFVDKQQVDVVSKMDGMTEEQLITLTDILIQLEGKPQNVIQEFIKSLEKAGA